MSSSPATVRVRIASKRLEATDVFSFELVPVQGQALPAFSAGSHIDVHLGAGLTRQYSLCNDPDERHRYLVAVLRDAKTRGGSRRMHDLRVGDELTIGVPRNHFALAPAAERSLLLAGGIGVTPLLSMAERLASAGAAFALHYCARSRSRAAFIDRIEEARYGANARLHFDDGDEAQKLPLAALVAARQPGTHLYVCGPKGFMDAVLGAARLAGWPDDRLHCEFFAAEVPVSERDGTFEVRLARTGTVVPVPAGRTIVQALAAAGCEVPTSCEQGVCGTCLTGVLEGEPDHRDMFLTPREQAANDRILPCCSRSRTPWLVLDL